MWPWASLGVSVCKMWQNKASWDTVSTWRGAGTKRSVNGTIFSTSLPNFPPFLLYLHFFILSSSLKKGYYYYFIDKEDKVRKVKWFVWGFFILWRCKRRNSNLDVGPFFLGQDNHFQTFERVPCIRWRYLEVCWFRGQSQD